MEKERGVSVGDIVYFYHTFSESIVKGSIEKVNDILFFIWGNRRWYTLTKNDVILGYTEQEVAVEYIKQQELKIERNIKKISELKGEVSSLEGRLTFDIEELRVFKDKYKV